MQPFNYEVINAANKKNNRKFALKQVKKKSFHLGLGIDTVINLRVAYLISTEKMKH